jgi:hypothetical protein
MTRVARGLSEPPIVRHDVLRGGRREQLRFQLVAPKSKGPFIGFDLGQQPALIRGFLRSHSAMLVEIDRSIGHFRDLVGLLAEV